MVTNFPLWVRGATTCGFCLLLALINSLSLNSGRMLPLSSTLLLPSRTALLLPLMFVTTLVALSPQRARAAASRPFFAVCAASESLSISATTLYLGAPPFMPSPGLKISAHCRRTFFRMTGAEDAKLDAMIVVPKSYGLKKVKCQKKVAQRVRLAWALPRTQRLSECWVGDQ